jgi:hypothetical protein
MALKSATQYDAEWDAAAPSAVVMDLDAAAKQEFVELQQLLVHLDELHQEVEHEGSSNGQSIDIDEDKFLARWWIIFAVEINLGAVSASFGSGLPDGPTRSTRGSRRSTKARSNCGWSLTRRFGRR